MKPYPKSKPSDVDWLGDVPEHWTVVPFKHSCRQFAVYGANMSSDEYVPDGIRFLRTTDIGELGELQQEGVFIEPDQALGYLLADQDILLSRSGTLGRAFVYLSTIHPVCAYAGYLVKFVPSSRLNSRFFFHFTKSIAFTDWLETQLISSTIGNVNGQKYAQCPLPLPERDEQDLIAAYLDRETGRMDELVSKKRALIERLKEKRTALISRTVTRGLPDGLPPETLAELEAIAGEKLTLNLPQKTSGINWLGDLPEHWEVWKLAHACTRILDGTHFSPESAFEGEKLYITAKNIKEWGIDLSNVTYVSEEDHRAIYARCPVKRNDVLYIKDGATAGIATVNNLNEEFSLLSSVALLRPKILVLEPRYLAYQMNTRDFKRYVLNSLVGGAMTRFTLEIISKFKLVVPPISEQRAIAAYLDEETAKLDALVAKVETAIERLQEYRTALITAAVTGKIDVREEVAV